MSRPSLTLTICWQTRRSMSSTPSFPPLLHGHQGLKAGKHVICEKPLTGYFGKPGEENVGRTEKAKM